MERKLAIWLAILSVLAAGGPAHGFIGIYWGRYATQSMVPSMVVDLLLQNGISEIRLYSPSTNVLTALEDSSLGVTVTLTNDFVKRMKWSNLQSVRDWINELVAVPVKRGVNIRTIIVLDEPFYPVKGMDPIWNATNVFRETVDCLQKANLSHIRTTTTHFSNILKVVRKPSEADFQDEYKDKMLEYLSLYNSTNSFFMFDLYPIFSAQLNNWPIEFAFMDNKSNFTIVDGKYTYTNAFEFMFDALVVAIEKAGYPDMEIAIGQVGWPTDGAKDANITNAERFYRSFLMHIARKKGTPRRPNTNIDVFLATLTDENKIPLQVGPYQRRRGIYNYDGTPKFKIDFSGQGRDMYPWTAKGIVKMPSRWCIFNGDTSNLTKVDEQVRFACNKSDCTSLYFGSSCGNLNYTWNASYAFNMYYQSNNQELSSGACGFAGLGALTPYDPSVGTCTFPVEILTAENVDGGRQLANYIGYSQSGGALHKTPYPTLGLPLLATFFVFLKHTSRTSAHYLPFQ
ncbi:unnamed protein product [Cuscuta campestris]|uniref:X8 domain-containing protein n=1 Tax=Cuscuta campestris TaxID=132261 RepID=A0A484N1M5_9ASTE|nr:unnamed protein product [Cuscuta campestris]